MQKDSAQAKILLKVVGGLLFLTHPVYKAPRWCPCSVFTVNKRDKYCTCTTLSASIAYLLFFLFMSPLRRHIFVCF